MNLIKSYGNLSKELKAKFLELYPDGFENNAKSIKLGTNFYLVVPFTTESANYLIKIKKLISDKGEFDVSNISFEGPSEEIFD